MGRNPMTVPTSERPHGESHPEIPLQAYLWRLRLARIIASTTSDIPFWRRAKNLLLAYLLDAPGIKMSSHVRLDRSHPELGGRLSFGRDVEIGPRVILDLSGGISIDDGVTVSEDSLLLSHNHGYQRADISWRDQGLTAQPIKIGRGAWVGARSTVLGSAHSLGAGCIIGATSLVTKPVPDMAVAVGSPCKVIKYRSHPSA